MSGTFQCCDTRRLVPGDYGDSLVSEWESIYLADAVKRLQPYAQGLNLTTKLLADMQSLCAYEVIICKTSPYHSALNYEFRLLL